MFHCLLRCLYVTASLSLFLKTVNGATIVSVRQIVDTANSTDVLLVDNGVYELEDDNTIVNITTSFQPLDPAAAALVAGPADASETLTTGNTERSAIVRNLNIVIADGVNAVLQVTLGPAVNHALFGHLIQTFARQVNDHIDQQLNGDVGMPLRRPVGFEISSDARDLLWHFVVRNAATAAPILWFDINEILLELNAQLWQLGINNLVQAFTLFSDDNEPIAFGQLTDGPIPWLMGQAMQQVGGNLGGLNLGG